MARSSWKNRKWQESQHGLQLGEKVASASWGQGRLGFLIVEALTGHGFSRANKRSLEMMDYTCCGKTRCAPRERQEVSGHDFSRADKAS
jgi:hypothetical protein